MNSNKLILEEKNRLSTKKKELTTALNTFFVNIAEHLDIKKENGSSLNSIKYQNKSDVSEKLPNHPSVHKIRQTFTNDEKFSFKGTLMSI